MSNHTAPQVDISEGPVTLLTHVLRDLLRREQAIDRMEVAQEIDKEQIEAYRRYNLQAIEGIERVMACLAAAGPQEAVVQVLVAAGQLNSIDVTSDETSSVPERLETAVQLLRSALPVLAATTQVDLTHYGVERYGLAASPSPFFPANPGVEQDNDRESV